MRVRALKGQGLAPILDPLLNDSACARAVGHFVRLRKHPAFAPDVEPYLEKIEASTEQGVP
jgi:hypothetical protein